MTEEDMLSLSGKVWVPIPRISRKIPFGYYVSEEDPEVLIPNIFELEALEMAKKHKKNGFSYVKVAAWLSSVTGRPISHTGLMKRMQSDDRNRRKAETLANWARRTKEAIQKAKELDERLGNDTSVYDHALADLVRVSSHSGKTT